VTLAVASSLLIGCSGTTAHKATTRGNAAPAGTQASATAARTTAAPFGENPDKPIVRIGSVTVTAGELHHWASVGVHGKIEAPEPPDFTGCVTYLSLPRRGERSTRSAAQLKLFRKRRYEEAVRNALNLLIHARWLIDEAAAMGVRIDEASLMRETTLSGPRGNEVKQALRTKGETISDRRFGLTLVQLSTRLERKVERQAPAITRKQIAGYFRLHKASFATPEQRDLRIVRLDKRGEADAAKREIERGTGFATIVGHTSLGQPSGAQNGLLRGLKPENWPEKPLSEEIFHAPLHKVEGPVQISLGYYVFEVVGKVPGRQKTFAEASAEVRTKLHQLMRERIAARVATALMKRWAPRTICLPGAFIRDCRDAKAVSATLAEVPNLLF
jgi:hypothetical protein